MGNKFIPALWVLTALTAGAAEDILIANFEGTYYENWTVTGEEAKITALQFCELTSAWKR